MRPEDAWQAVLGEVELTMGKSSVVTWLKSARLVAYEDGHFIIGVFNGYVKEWIEHRKRAEIRRMLAERMGCAVEVSFAVISQSGALSNAVVSDRSAPARVVVSPPRPPVVAPPVAPLSTLLPAPVAAPVQVSTVPAPVAPLPVVQYLPPVDGLNPHYVFEAFIVGSGNRMAHAAASAVAEAPASRYNPLFLYGGSGLGKTHLLHAIGHSARRRGMTVRYVTSETFTNELIASIRGQSQEAFRAKYRSVDVLLMDDVQFIAGKESTQEEFFHTFNALHGANKQLVVTSDRAPKMMVTLEDRLRSRFEWGLMTDIAPPDLETRIAILLQKVSAIGAEVPMDVIEFVAKQVQSNVRELEGALTRLIATAEMTGRQISVQTARDSLVDLVGKRSHITPSQVIETVAKYYNISVPEMVSPSRNKELVQPRQLAMYLIRQETEASLPEIGGLLGGRDHTTILHGVERVKNRLETEEKLRRDVMSLREQLYLNVKP
ncbi:MAG: chromosomal replication initiator protein DnaA [Chloroflexi bacterium]|nr:chromosomal replication initiator protein DnaA [Chloroflexota bacterium]